MGASEFRIWMGAAVAIGLIVAFTSREPRVCFERDTQMAERAFTACVAAVAPRDSDAPRICLRQTDELACKSWGRP